MESTRVARPPPLKRRGDDQACHRFDADACCRATCARGIGRGAGRDERAVESLAALEVRRRSERRRPGGQTSAPKAAWYETIKPAVASTLTLAVTGAIYGAVSGAVQDATSALLKASPPSKSGADLNAGALPLAAVMSGLAGGVCGGTRARWPTTESMRTAWRLGQAGKGMRVLVAAGVGGGTAAAVFMGTAIASLYAVGRLGRLFGKR